MEDSIERVVVWNESNDQLKSECVESKESYIARVKSESVMHVGH